MRPPIRLALTIVLSLAGPWQAFAQTHQDMALRAGSLSSYGGDVTVGGNDGSLSYTYPFGLPQSRGRFQPKLVLRYSSNGGSSPYGVGWLLPLTFIERAMRASPNNVSAGNPRRRYWLILDGSGSPLVPFGQAGHYRFDVSRGFLDVVRNGSDDSPNFWEALDGRGNRYLFKSAYGPAGGSCTPSVPCTRWYLTQVSDVDGNVVNYQYTSEGQSASALLTGLRYNAYDPNSPSNTGKVGDTGSYATAVDLEYESEPHPQIEVIAGSLVEHSQRLANLRIKTRGSQGFVTLFTYAITFIPSTETGRSLLSGIQLKGLQGATGPRPTRFTYQGRLDAGVTNYAGFKDAVSIALPGGDPTEVRPPPARCRLWFRRGDDTSRCGLDALATWIDIDGDKRPDLVWGGGGAGIRWARNNTAAGATTLSFENVKVLPGSNNFRGTISFDHPTGEQTTGSFPLGVRVSSRLLDVNGDGRPDLVDGGGVGGNCPATRLQVRFAEGAGSNAQFAAPICMDAAAASAEAIALWQSFDLSLTTDGGDTVVDLVDLTGDGVPDYVIATKTDGWHVYPGERLDDGSWAFAPQYRKFRPLNAIRNVATPIRRARGSTFIDLVDVNGDGLLDRVVASPGTPGTWNVEYNTGFEFKARPSDPARAWVTGNEAVQAIADSMADDDSGDENSFGYRGLLVDLNGDGLPDYVYKWRCRSVR